MSIHLPQKTLLPSISSLTLDDDEDVGSAKYDGESDIQLTPERIEKVVEEEANDDASDSIQEVMNHENHLPKDFGEINVKGHLHFDDELPPDENTQNNTIYNAMLYQLNDKHDRDHIHHHNHHHSHDNLNSPSDINHTKKNLMFDTYNPNQDVSLYQMTIIHEDKHFQYQNTTRTFFVPYDDEKPSDDAITWTIGQMANDNDIIIILKVVSLQHIMKFGVQSHRKDCKILFKSICKHNINKKKLKIIVEIRIGSIEYSLARGLKEFDPNFMVMGTHGIKKAKITSFLNEDTSMTKHFLDNSWIPVIVINPLYESIVENNQDSKFNKYSFKNKLTNYPSVYDPLNGNHTLEMERSHSSESNGLNSTVGRTSRFLRIGRSMSRSSSINKHNNNPTPTNGTPLSPTTSNDRSPSRGLSPRRGLSPFRLFHSSRHTQP
ncbi:hypothetical protein C6P40_001826 [Pichia californica]|uniref:UspA domain-containing protein n=1 Tax=Pichia californica TaxID=460514 RepID=A0A9P6WJ05_9ASCO|nr:hypothetical protein C6P40_001826 [[Candida] californica]